MKQNGYRRLLLSMLVILLVGAALPVRPAQAQWVFVARKVLGRVEQMTQPSQNGQPGYDVATVVLDAPASKVYATALNMIRQNPAVQITGEDAARNQINLLQGDRTGSLRVTMLSDKVSQLMIVGTAGPGEDSSTSRMLAAVLRVCREMHKQCSLTR